MDTDISYKLCDDNYVTSQNCLSDISTSSILLISDCNTLYSNSIPLL